MAIHGYVNTGLITGTVVDAYVRTGVYATGDLDNGTLVTLGTINQDTTSKAIEGFEYNVAMPAANATGLWLIASPEVGTTIEMQELSDPRLFYNPAGIAFQMYYLNAGTDSIEVTKECFAGGALPTTAQGYATVNTSGQFVVASSAPASGTYFIVEGFHTVTVGMVDVPTVVLRTAVN